MSTDSLIVRRIKSEDHGGVASMRARLWPEGTRSLHLKELESQVRDRKFRAWVALKGREHLGFCEAYLRPYANGCDTMPIVFLEGIWVVPAWRGKGIGWSLLGAVEAWARSRGDSEMASDALLSNTLSRRRHRAWGFQALEKVECFSKRLA